MKFSDLAEKIMKIPNMAEKFLTNTLKTDNGVIASVSNLPDDMWRDWMKHVVFSCRMSTQFQERFAKFNGQGDNYWTHCV